MNSELKRRAKAARKAEKKAEKEIAIQQSGSTSTKNKEKEDQLSPAQYFALRSQVEILLFSCR